MDWGLSSSQNMPNLCKGFQSLYKFSFPKPSCIRLDIVINPKKNVFFRAYVEDEIIAMANKKASIQIQILIPFKVQVLLHFHSFSFQVRVLNRNFFQIPLFVVCIQAKKEMHNTFYQLAWNSGIDVMIHNSSSLFFSPF